ncbi:hypothetical protein AVDCRST_MAG94-4186, partial [uncultured Leptolyngbya sp.]
MIVVVGLGAPVGAVRRAAALGEGDGCVTIGEEGVGTGLRSPGGASATGGALQLPSVKAMRLIRQAVKRATV